MCARPRRAWSVWEGATSYLRLNPDYVAKFQEDAYAAAFARIECHYFVNKGFLRTDNQLHRGRRPDPQNSGGHRAGPLRRGLPDEERLGPASGVA